MDYTMVLFAGAVAGLVVLLNGVVQLAVRNKTGVWRDGGASVLVGIIVAGVSVGLLVWYWCIGRAPC